MSSDPQLRIERAGEIARLVINRPERQNALSLEMWRAVPDHIGRFESDPLAKVLIIQGATPKAFAVGADIEELLAHSNDAAAARGFMGTVHSAEQAVGDCAKPTIAMIRGNCFGGGVELAMACDIRFASAESRFALPPAKLGVVYSLSSTRRLARLVGPGRAADLLFSGRTLDAAEAEAIGLVEHLVTADAVEAEVQKYAELLCRRSQVSIRAAKQTLREIANGMLAESPELEEIRTEAMLGSDLREGAKAFLEKRPPSFPSS
jgi:enoyl-CoA hydratase